MGAPVPPPLPPLSPGEFAPWFKTAAPGIRSYSFHTVGGRYILLGFLPTLAERGPAMLAIAENRKRFSDDHLACFLVARDEQTIAQAINRPGLRWLSDADGEVSRQYGALDADGREHPQWLLLDPSLRILRRFAIGDPGLGEALAALPAVADYAGTPLHAPVLIVPRIFEPELCRELIGVYEADGGRRSGVMRDIDGRTVPVIDEFKSRRDAAVRDPELQKRIVHRLRTRLAPEVEKAFQFRPTRVERYTVACYDAQEGGYFRAHRDNQALATRHRRFAVSINLNAEEFEGGDLCFPEFGPRTYRPPTGGAVVFACGLLHEATPVTRGRRYAYLPFLYDEEGARIRQEGEAFLDVSAGGRAGAREPAEEAQGQ